MITVIGTRMGERGAGDKGIIVTVCRRLERAARIGS